MAMTLDNFVHILDREFSVTDWNADPAMSRLVPRTYQTIGYDFATTFEPDFCARFNGLMLRGGDIVTEVYCAAFPTPEILEAVLKKAGHQALLFLHHPLDMETSGRGFLPIPPRHLQAFTDRDISIYACHAPLDCHARIGTAASLANAFMLEQVREFARYGHRYAARIGSVSPTTVEELVRTGQREFNVERVERGGGSPSLVTCVAVIPGGGDDPGLHQEAEQLGAQVVITGEWYTRLMTLPNPDDASWAKENREACQAYARTSSMALLGFSHAATEYLVMEKQIAPYLRDLGLMVACVRQSDWWR